MPVIANTVAIRAPALDILSAEIAEQRGNLRLLLLNFFSWHRGSLSRKLVSFFRGEIMNDAKAILMTACCILLYNHSASKKARLKLTEPMPAALVLRFT